MAVLWLVIVTVITVFVAKIYICHESAAEMYDEEERKFVATLKSSVCRRCGRLMPQGNKPALRVAIIVWKKKRITSSCNQAIASVPSTCYNFCAQ
jgi:hypothetical protein